MTDNDVLEALREVIDPELGINVVDLGLVYGVDVADDRVHVRMTMTSLACPLSVHLAEVARSIVRSRWPNIDVEVEIVWDPPWDPERMSDAARRQLGG